ncbi:hypothetical protein BHE74_00036975 [Ensete ventricosum]|nr:hypothetical protein BHE74_00036975 [Ensete ventricosum]RZR98813.1 hypothetical protein BHM03_00028252 [Ensete ventricosum]
MVVPSANAGGGRGGESRESVDDRRFLRCVNCGLGMRSLFVQYSPGNIRLMKCVSETYRHLPPELFREHCKAVADPYIECEFMVVSVIILIDMILHKRKAYRHLLFNMLNLGAGDSKAKILYRQILVAILVSSYFKLFLVAMMFYNFLFTVVTELQTAGCLGVCFGAHAAKFFSDHWLLRLLSG